MNVRRVAALGFAILVSGGLAESAQAAAPRLITFDAKPLGRAVVVSDWNENSSLVSAWVSGRQASRSERRGRPFLRVAPFWGPAWNDYVKGRQPLSGLKPSQASQFGRFYPAVAERPAIIDLPRAGRWPKRVKPTTFEILRRHSMPTRLRAGPPPAPVRACETRAEGGKAPTSYSLPGDLVIGPIAFRGLRAIAQPRVFRESRRGGIYVVKAGVIVRAGNVVTVAITGGARSWVSLSYASRRLRNVSDGSAAVRFEACSADEPAFSYRGPVGIVTGFAGGLLIAHPGCVPLDVWVKGRPQPIRRVVSFGAGRCAG